MTLDVVVTDKVGVPVSGLKPGDFKVFDSRKENAEVRVQAASAEDPPAQVMLLLDAINTSHQSFGRAKEQVEGLLRANGGRLAQPVSVLILPDTRPRQ